MLVALGFGIANNPSLSRIPFLGIFFIPLYSYLGDTVGSVIQRTINYKRDKRLGVISVFCYLFGVYVASYFFYFLLIRYLFVSEEVSILDMIFQFVFSLIPYLIDFIRDLGVFSFLGAGIGARNAYRRVMQ